MGVYARVRGSECPEEEEEAADAGRGEEIEVGGAYCDADARVSTAVNLEPTCQKR